MVSDQTSAGRRVLLNRLYADYAADPAFAHMLTRARGVVPGDGPTDPRLLFVGEAPGSNEDKQGRPFIGASGRFLAELLASVGIARSEVFITNTVKIRPVSAEGRNRPPSDNEKKNSIPYLRRELALLGNPPVVVLGKHAKGAMAHISPHGTKLGDPTLNMHIGEWTTSLGVPMLPLHHPAYGLYQQANRPMMFEMFKAVLTPPRMPA